jgi:hypothetical protein
LFQANADDQDVGFVQLDSPPACSAHEHDKVRF